MKLFVPLFFSKPEKQVGKLFHAAKPDSFGGRTGILITNGKEKTAPKLAVDSSIQASLRN